jgi:hypothetical protein
MCKNNSWLWVLVLIVTFITLSTQQEKQQSFKPKIEIQICTGYELNDQQKVGILKSFKGSIPFLSRNDSAEILPRYYILYCVRTYLMC